MQVERFSDLEEALAYYRQQGFVHVFECCAQGWQCRELDQVFCPEAVQIDTCQRFQRCGGTHKVAVLYTVVAPGGTKGIILDNCSTYGDVLFGEYLVRMKLRQLQPAPAHRYAS
ncbi:hypothetical protein [Rufibacter psychrotolerans]|uniref:hypothetical protein n=1 Tax=Rufibacter psychrotolerans TaxID=2812556 RepID=UPI001966E32D|nr:hypothetical protein [Rufibacter sp. SYSU D00308]